MDSPTQTELDARKRDARYLEDACALVNIPWQPGRRQTVVSLSSAESEYSQHGVMCKWSHRGWSTVGEAFGWKSVRQRAVDVLLKCSKFARLLQNFSCQPHGRQMAPQSGGESDVSARGERLTVAMELVATPTPQPWAARRD